MVEGWRGAAGEGGEVECCDYEEGAAGAVVNADGCHYGLYVACVSAENRVLFGLGCFRRNSVQTVLYSC